MPDGIVHLCYAGVSGATRAALNISASSGRPARHAYVLYGVGPPRAEHVAELERRGCVWRYVPKRPGLDAAGYYAAAAAMTMTDAQAAIVHGLATLPVAMALRAIRWDMPIVAVHHGPPAQLCRRSGKLAAIAFAWLADATVAVSRGLADLLAGVPLLRLLAGPIAVVLNAVDVDFWSAMPPRVRPAGSPVRLGMIAAIEPTKDHATLLKALALLARGPTRAQLELIGGGSLASKVMAMTKDLGVAPLVSCTGFLSPTEVRSRLGDLDIVVHSTPGEGGLPLALMEAMAAGRPVIATDSPGVRELVQDHGTGLLVPPADPAALAEAIASMAADRNMARRLADAAAVHVRRRHSTRTTALAYESIVDRLVAVRRIDRLGVPAWHSAARDPDANGGLD